MADIGLGLKLTSPSLGHLKTDIGVLKNLALPLKGEKKQNTEET